LSSNPGIAIIKDVIVWLDGGISDEIRLAAADAIARRCSQPRKERFEQLGVEPVSLGAPMLAGHCCTRSVMT
jgi:hypothetical protein